MPRIAILDPCYHKKGGHHHGVNTALSRHLKWFDAEIYSDFSLELGEVMDEYFESDLVRPTFAGLGYIDPQHYATIGSFCEKAKEFYRQLRPVNADILIAHTLLHFHLYGLGLYLANKPARKVLISLMFSPFEGLRTKPNEPLDLLFTSMALRSLNDAALSSGHGITIGITSEFHWELLEEFRKDFPFLNFSRSPWLVGAHNAKNHLEANSFPHQKDKEDSKATILLYLGDAKPDKGIEAVSEFLQWLAQQPQEVLSAAAEKLRLEVHVTHCDDWLKPCVESISSLCSGLPDIVTFSSKHYKTSEYFDILSSASAIVWLYDPRRYKYRTSGIFYDAVSLRCLSSCDNSMPSLVVSEGSWMEKEANLLGLSPATIDLSKPGWMHDLWQYLINSTGSNRGLPDPKLDLLAYYRSESWNSWVTKTLGLHELTLLNQIRQLEIDRRPLIVISTDYPHFTRLSGPTGFISYLDDAFHFKTQLGRSPESDWIRALSGLRSATDDALRLEKKLISVLRDRPANIICIDGEHAGSLLALAQRDQRIHPETCIYSWFHQPLSILESDIVDKTTLSASQVYPVCISPCQVPFFRDHLGIPECKVTVIPHGVHAELIKVGQQGLLERASRLARDSYSRIRLLTVGNWLRDRALIFDAAEACPDHEFTWVSTGMRLEQHEQAKAQTLGNLKIITDGLSNRELHKEYIDSDYLFQPLVAATANNAIIEAMAFGLPIITKRLVSTVYYTGGEAQFYSDPREAITLLRSLSPARRPIQNHGAQNLSSQAKKLEWSRVARLFIEVLAEE